MEVCLEKCTWDHPDHIWSFILCWNRLNHCFEKLKWLFHPLGSLSQDHLKHICKYLLLKGIPVWNFIPKENWPTITGQPSGFELALPWPSRQGLLLHKKRCYKFFEIIFGTRSHHGLAPVFEYDLPEGSEDWPLFPKDISPESRQILFPPDYSHNHSHTSYTLKQLLDFDWKNKPLVLTRMKWIRYENEMFGGRAELPASAIVNGVATVESFLGPAVLAEFLNELEALKSLAERPEDIRILFCADQ